MNIVSVAFTEYDSDPRVRRMCEALAARGDTVTAIVLRTPGQPMRRTLDGVEIVGLATPRYQGTSILTYLWQYLRFAVLAAWRLVREHRDRPIDLVHVNNMPDFLVFAAAPVKALGSKVILDLHDPMPELFLAKMQVGRGWKYRAVLLVERLSIGFADEAISVQQGHIDVFVSHGNARSKFTEVQNTPDASLFPERAALDNPDSSHRSDEVKTVVYHGTVAPRLGVDLLVRGVMRAHETDARIRALIIGDGDDADRVEDLIDELDADAVVEFRRGFIPVDLLLPELATADIGVVPAMSDPFTDSMLPSKLLEYVTIGLPVVSSDLPGVRRYFSDQQMAYYPPGDADALASQILRLAQDEEAARAQAESALSFLEEHGWRAERDRYLALVDALVAG